MKYSMVMGRFQPLHKGHIALINNILNEGKNVCVAIKDTELDEYNPYTTEQRKATIGEYFWEEINHGTLTIIVVPDIMEVCYGRRVGWGIREIKLDPEIEAISATNIRKEKA